MRMGSFGSFVTHGKVLWRMVAAGIDPLRDLQKHGDSSTSILDRYRFSCGRLRRPAARAQRTTHGLRKGGGIVLKRNQAEGCEGESGVGIMGRSAFACTTRTGDAERPL
jgi:hypothetical protein